MSHYFNLGDYQYPVTTSSDEAQTWFNRGLTWCYGFNHEEAVRCFQNALAADPACAMACWGIAYASGPFYNKPWDFFADDERRKALAFCHEHIQKAITLSTSASAVEKALIMALAKRYPTTADPVDQGTFDQWTDDYAEAMRAVYKAHSENLDVIALAAEALMNRTPWRLWNVHAGVPAANASTEEAIAMLQRGIKIYEGLNLRPHVGIIHFWIHVWEMSPTPERAIYAADLMRVVVPDSGHLLHMGSHIDVLCGQYYEAVAANNRAICADQKYIDRRGRSEFYMISCCHDLKLKIYAAMFLGQFQSAMDAMDTMLAWLSDDIVRGGSPYMQEMLEGYTASRPHILVRFGRWREIIDLPMPEDPEFRVMGTAMMLYAKGIAHAALDHIEQAEECRASFREYCNSISPDRVFGNNTAMDVLRVGHAMLDGELAYRKGDYDVAFDHLRTAVYRDDSLNFAEPWDWMHPPRHALGALLLEQARDQEALEVYEADLGFSNQLPRCCQHPENVWALHGYVEALERVGKSEEARAHRTRLQLALARTDVPILASCCCRRERS